MRHKIKNWLADPERSFQSGLDLFNQVKIATHYDKFFALNSNPNRPEFVFKMLEQQLQNALRKLEQNAENKPEERVNTLPVPSKPITTAPLNITKQSVRIIEDVKLSELPVELQEKYKRTKQIVPEMNAVQQELREDISDEQRMILSEKLCDLEDEKDACWKAIDDFTSNQGANVQEKNSVNIAMEALAKKKRHDNLIIYIGRAKKDLDTGQIPESDGERINKKIDAWRKELAELKKELNIPIK